MYCYAAIALLCLAGLFLRLGPFVLGPLAAAAISVTIISDANPVSQLLFFMFWGLVIGALIDHQFSKSRREHLKLVRMFKRLAAEQEKNGGQNATNTDV